MDIKYNPDGSLALDCYQGLIEVLTNLHGEDLINILHRTFSARAGEHRFRETQVQVPGEQLPLTSITALFDVPEVQGETSVTPARRVTVAMSTRQLHVRPRRTLSPKRTDYPNAIAGGEALTDRDMAKVLDVGSAGVELAWDDDDERVQFYTWEQVREHKLAFDPPKAGTVLAWDGINLMVRWHESNGNTQSYTRAQIERLGYEFTPGVTMTLLRKD